MNLDKEKIEKLLRMAELVDQSEIASIKGVAS
jgi:hypothetical protein